ncbi:nucleolar complex protein 2 homolog [Zingiber officinale]|uniref:nucleolar complex protein 2 homolog n=1 Tax=Zingiber officinale TaxID=94328 RepID=UPI001C4CFFAD|nr:nucleolar complex protein 2 homolog [Zingiber officinale]XP_042437817.1 nucleolar complex protein 2 homolog [Zingiber officinale]XP_042437825.1 nucleolar complex protein 2 homolog [Zingiber officinale]XP_042437834.1 nucleolar complex protein 2 homolog [Zingiber officinale]XP_042437843.1 nucleolar complex protein 2 homolog [Zingiber officinale]XP_042437852.1 nucleolar complex protein 2 homolog [Zingiber officinale]XP_042437860.1 nucleolar complex protein 2 homolog [Zingiber officinale]XP_0
MSGIEDSDESTHKIKRLASSGSKAKEHVKQLQRLQEKDPEFYQYMKEHDKELLEFDAEEIDDEADTDVEVDADTHVAVQEDKQTEKAITAAMVDYWCKAIKDYKSLHALKSLLRV